MQYTHTKKQEFFAFSGRCFFFRDWQNSWFRCFFCVHSVCKKYLSGIFTPLFFHLLEFLSGLQYCLSRTGILYYGCGSSTGWATYSDWFCFRKIPILGAASQAHIIYGLSFSPPLEGGGAWLFAKSYFLTWPIFLPSPNSASKTLQFFFCVLAGWCDLLFRPKARGRGV